jgi:hypothetical protein
MGFLSLASVLWVAAAPGASSAAVEPAKVRYFNRDIAVLRFAFLRLALPVPAPEA